MKAYKNETLIALKKAKTSIEKIQKMIDEDRYCIDILNQILAVQGLLKSSSEKILSEHIKTCFADGLTKSSSKKKDELVSELMNVMKLAQKSK